MVKSMLVLFYVMSYGGYGDDVAMRMMTYDHDGPIEEEIQ
jgi:hypothetical protein